MTFRATGAPIRANISTASETVSELVDVRAVAAMLDASTRHVYRLADAGLMPGPMKLGALVRWRRRQVLDWINAGCPAVAEQHKSRIEETS